MSRSREGDPELPDELARLPHGRHGLPPEFVERNQRQRLITSLTAIIGERGYAEATIDSITSGAAVSSRTFYKYFETVEECYVAAFDDAIERLEPLLADAYLSKKDWPKQVRAGLAALLQSFSENPDLARLLTAEPFVAGPEVALRHKQALERLAPYLRAGREYSNGAEQLPETTERGLLGAANSLVGRKAFSGTDAAFDQLLADLTQFLLTPYLGAAKARKLAVG